MLKTQCSVRFVQFDNRFRKYLEKMDSQRDTQNICINFGSTEKQDK